MRTDPIYPLGRIAVVAEHLKTFGPIVLLQPIGKPVPADVHLLPLVVDLRRGPLRHTNFTAMFCAISVDMIQTEEG